MINRIDVDVDRRAGREAGAAVGRAKVVGVAHGQGQAFARRERFGHAPHGSGRGDGVPRPVLGGLQSSPFFHLFKGYLSISSTIRPRAL